MSESVITLNTMLSRRLFITLSFLFLISPAQAQIRHGIFIDGGRSFAVRDGSTADYFGYELILDGPNQGQKRDINSHLASGWQFSGGYQLFLGKRWNLALGMFLVRGENSVRRNVFGLSEPRPATRISKATREGALLNIGYDIIPFYPYPQGRIMKDFALSLTLGGQLFKAHVEWEEYSHIDDPLDQHYYESIRDYENGLDLSFSSGLQIKYRFNDNWIGTIGAEYAIATFIPNKSAQLYFRRWDGEEAPHKIENFIRRRIPFNHISSYCRITYVF